MMCNAGCGMKELRMSEEQTESDKERLTSRRELLAEAGRWALFAGLAAGVLWLARKGEAPTAAECPGPGACGRCPALAGCRLPRALTMKQTGQES
jgi:hypothetical protein